MKTHKIYITILFFVLGMNACTNNQQENDEKKDHKLTPKKVHISSQKFNSLNITLDTMQSHVFDGIVYTNGSLEVPPQHEATVTAVLGGNVVSVEVIEGTDIKKNEIIAYLSHPNFINIQTAYVKAFHQNEYLSKQFERQQKLSEAEIGAGKELQRIKSEYLSNKSDMNGYAAQLKQLNLSLEYIKNGNLYNKIPVRSPIKGSVEAIDVQTGQYVEAQTSMFKIVNSEHVHADFMVFEKDVMHVKKGQQIEFTVSTSEEPLQAEIISVGKRFEKAPRAVHVHAEIKGKDFHLVAGMYIQGKIFTESKRLDALPESAVITEDGNTYIFITTPSFQKKEKEFEFKMLEVKTGKQEGGWVEIKPIDLIPDDALIVQNDAYYLIAEMMKTQTEHIH